MEAAFYIVALLDAGFESQALARYNFHADASDSMCCYDKENQAPTSARWNSAQLIFAAFFAPFSVKVSKQRALVV